ncbi:MAG: hypothetical protein AB7O52_07970 [Planctomycetota bacterium]
MKSPWVLGVAVFLVSFADLASAAFNEGLKIEVDYKNLYDFYDASWPSTVDKGIAFGANFYENSSGSKNYDPFRNQNMTVYTADQNQLTNLTITSVLDLFNNYPSEFAKYSATAVTLDGGAGWNSSFLPPGQWATFFVIPVTVGSTVTYYMTQIYYYEVVDYSQQNENWSVGPGWDGTTPFVFVNVVRRFVEFNGGPGAGGTLRGSEVWGLDVIDATAPRNESSLDILLPNASQPGGFSVKRLFPLSAHLADIDGPIGSGAVVEPNMSIDGNWVIFSYFHDVKNNLTVASNDSLPLKGADIYMIDLTSIKADPNVDPATLPYHRLTSTTWNPATGEQDLNAKNAAAMNPTLAQNVFPFDFRYGRLYMHAIETVIGGGRRLVFASNLRRLGNSNNAMSKGNYDLNLYEAKLNFNTGALTEVKQIHYYTTTSAMSPAPMRDGFSFAYQSTTEEARSWEVQITKSNYQWSPGVGYGINGQEVLHLQTLAATTTQDWLVTCYYYNVNNNGFGTIVANPTQSLGKNIEVYQPGDYTFGTAWGMQPRQVGLFNTMVGINAADDPINAGKLTAPRAGAENELFASYSPHSSNDRLFDSAGNKAYYDSYIVRFPNVDARLNGGSPWAVSELQTVLNDGSEWKAQIWGVPVLSHSDRYGEEPQSSPMVTAITDVPYYQNNPAAIHGMPLAVVGTSALSNTDVKTKDARLAPKGVTYNLGTMGGNEIIRIQNNVAGLSKVLTNSSGVPDILAEVCQEDILGVAVHLTSNKPDYSYSMDYKTAFGIQETTRLLGVYDVRYSSDDSFLATIPGNVPFELQLIDREYGLKLADQRSWKSLRHGELRNDCGGCHDHEGNPVAFGGTVASGVSYVPEDMASMTRYIEYDAFCDPLTTLSVSSQPTLEIPEYYDDILPGLQAHCGSCHTGGAGGSAAAATAFNLDNPGQAYADFVNKRYYNNDGALGSPLFWAARGRRTDNRANPGSGPWKYSSVHDGIGLCDGTSLANANFVYELGLWIDHLMPSRTTQAPQPYDPKFDRYHPAVNFDLKLINNNPAHKDINQLVVGYWDDSDFSPSGDLEIYVNGTLKHSQVVTANGSVFVNVSSWNLKRRDVIEAVIIDGVDNHQYYSKTYGSILPPPVQPIDPVLVEPHTP